LTISSGEIPHSLEKFQTGIDFSACAVISQRFSGAYLRAVRWLNDPGTGFAAASRPKNEFLMHKRILLVDNSPAQGELIAQALAQHVLIDMLEFEQSADSAHAYLEKHARSADQRLPDLALIDLKLNQTSGIDLVRRLRSDRRFAYLPIVVFTTSDDPTDVQAAYASGANGYVVKPNAFYDLVTLTGDLCRFWLDWNRTPKPC
jgi:CheY-like chemotaxis protein